MPTTFTPDELRARFKGQKVSPIYTQAVMLHENLRVHADGEMPIKLIKDARPNESEAVREYREKIYEAETQNPVERVFGLLEKIRRSPDWMIRFDNEVPPIINKEETLEKYLTENYPVYGHIEDWLFEEALRNIGLDANAVVIIMPTNLDINGNEYMEPIAQIFNSKNVIDFVAEDYVLVKSDEFSSLLTTDQQAQRANAYIAPGSTFIPSQVYYLVNTLFYQRWEETNDGKYTLTKQLRHGLNALPAFQMPGKFVRKVGKSTLKKTLLYAMVHHLNKAARESNDLDAGVIMHLYLEKWRINNVPCPTCNGTTKTTGPRGAVTCKTCEGTGMANGKSPFNEVVIKPAAIGEQNIPTPPLGYVQKDTKIIEIQNTRIEQHIYKALSAVNMEHLAEVQLNQSGVAKQFDRDDVNTLIYGFAGSLAYILNTAIFWITELRYGSIKDAGGNPVLPPEKRKELRPVIPVPEKFDVVNTTFLLSEYQVGKAAGLNAIMLSEMQKELAQKKFYHNPEVKDFVQTIMDLDPFPDKTIEEKALMEGQGLATKADVIMSNYISDFVKQSMEKDKNFVKKSLTDKRAILKVLADEKVDELNTAAQMSADIFGTKSATQQPAQVETNQIAAA